MLSTHTPHCAAQGTRGSEPACTTPWTTHGGDPSQEPGPKSKAEGAEVCPQGRESRGKSRGKGKGHRHQPMKQASLTR